MRLAWAVLITAGCGRVGFDPLTGDAGDGGPCTLGAWSAPSSMTGVTSPGNDYNPALSSDGLILQFSSDRAGGVGGFDLYEATRPNASVPFGNVTNMGLVNSSSDDETPTETPDRRTLYFASDRTGNYRLYRSMRANPSSAWGAPVAVPEMAGEDMWGASLSADGTELLYNHRVPTTEIFRATWNGSSFILAGELGELSTGFEGWPSLTADGLELYFTTERAETGGKGDVYHAVRPSIGAPFSMIAPVSVAAVTGVDESDAVISADNRNLIWVVDTNPAHLVFSTRACQ